MTSFVNVILFKKFENKFTIIIVYVDDLNIKSCRLFKERVWHEDLGMTKLYLGLKIGYLKNEIFVY